MTRRTWLLRVVRTAGTALLRFADAMPLSSPSSGLRPRQPGSSGSSRSSGPSSDWTPLSGKECFAQALQVDAGPSSNFRVYYTPPSVSPGGGLDDDDQESPVVFVCHHGAGYSAMSFALLAKELVKESGGKSGVLALDCRGHGAYTLLAATSQLLWTETFSRPLSRFHELSMLIQARRLHRKTPRWTSTLWLPICSLF